MFQRRLGATIKCPGRKRPQRCGLATQISAHVEGDVQAALPRLFDHLQHFEHDTFRRPDLRHIMRYLNGHRRLMTHINGFCDRFPVANIPVADVRCIEGTVFFEGLDQGDQFLGGAGAAGGIFQTGRYSAGALGHGLLCQADHLLQIGFCCGLHGCSRNGGFNRAMPHEGDNIDGATLVFISVFQFRQGGP